MNASEQLRMSRYWFVVMLFYATDAANPLDEIIDERARAALVAEVMEYGDLTHSIRFNPKTIGTLNGLNIQRALQSQDWTITEG